MAPKRKGKKGKGGKKRKPCELGDVCPYKHEGQHRGEYCHPGEPDHPDTPKPAAKPKCKGRTLSSGAGGGRAPGGGQTLGIVSRHHVDHMLCVSALLPTLGATFSELMSFRDSELYLVPARPEAVGQPFGALVQRLPDCVLLGIKASFPLFEQAPSPLIITRRLM